MLTLAQITAESQSPALTDDQINGLTLLVRQYTPYAKNPALWPNFETKLAEEQGTPTAKTKVLKAVLTSLGRLPSIVVESQGQTSSPAFFATKANWDSLAIDVLNTFYRSQAYQGPELIGVVNRTTQSMTIKDRTTFTEKETGRRY